MDTDLRALERRLRADPTDSDARSELTTARLRQRLGHVLVFDRRLRGSVAVRYDSPCSRRGWVTSVLDLADAARLLTEHQRSFDPSFHLLDLATDPKALDEKPEDIQSSFNPGRHDFPPGTLSITYRKSPIYARSHVSFRDPNPSNEFPLMLPGRPMGAASTNVHSFPVPSNETWLLYEVSLMPDCGTSPEVLATLRDHSMLELRYLRNSIADIPGRKALVEPPEPEDFWLHGSAPRGAVKIDVGGLPIQARAREDFMPILRVSKEAPPFDVWVMVVFGGIRVVGGL